MTDDYPQDPIIAKAHEATEKTEGRTGSEEALGSVSEEENPEDDLGRLLFKAHDKLEDYGSNEGLFEEVKAFVRVHWDHPDENAYDVFASFLIATYLSERFQFVPYLFFLGPPDSGKTRGLEIIQAVGYRAFIAPSASPASIFRIDELYNPVLLIDESEHLLASYRTDVISLLNQRYKRGGVVMRVINADRGKGTLVAYPVFGFAAIAGTKDLLGTLRSRCVPFYMTPSQRLVRRTIDDRWAQSLRNKLAKFREDVMSGRVKLAMDSESLTNPSSFVSSEDLETTRAFSRLNGLHGRLYELFHCLTVVAPPYARDRILDFAYRLEIERKQEASTDVDARVLFAILELKEKLGKGEIAMSEISSLLNDDLPERERLSTQKVGYVVKRLGFRRKRGSGGYAVVIYDEIQAMRLKARYAPMTLPENPSKPSDPSPETASKAS